MNNQIKIAIGRQIVMRVRQCLETSREAHLYFKGDEISVRGSVRSQGAGWHHIKMFTSIEQAKEYKFMIELTGLNDRLKNCLNDIAANHDDVYINRELLGIER